MKKLTVFALAVIMTLSFASLSFALKKDVEFPAVGDEGKVVFSHENHTEKKGFKCPDCHPGLFKMKKGGDKLTMADMEAGKNCGACHNGEKAFAVKSPDSCPKCHVK
ncbi:MAG: cytochrome c3 family protein [Nitrospirae bacterium]|nr:cytochrome c3 family protein [Nitrospirota bacterium]MBI5695027.1 cytochrome c3 family protein [Nitrospirota bacterium]